MVRQGASGEALLDASSTFPEAEVDVELVTVVVLFKSEAKITGG
jgi:hypothetical protein